MTSARTARDRESVLRRLDDERARRDRTIPYTWAVAVVLITAFVYLARWAVWNVELTPVAYFLAWASLGAYVLLFLAAALESRGARLLRPHTSLHPRQYEQAVVMCRFIRKLGIGPANRTAAAVMVIALALVSYTMFAVVIPAAGGLLLVVAWLFALHATMHLANLVWLYYLAPRKLVAAYVGFMILLTRQSLRNPEWDWRTLGAKPGEVEIVVAQSWPMRTLVEIIKKFQGSHAGERLGSFVAKALQRMIRAYVSPTGRFLGWAKRAFIRTGGPAVLTAVILLPDLQANAFDRRLLVEGVVVATLVALVGTAWLQLVRAYWDHTSEWLEQLRRAADQRNLPRPRVATILAVIETLGGAMLHARMSLYDLLALLEVRFLDERVPDSAPYSFLPPST